MMVDGRKQGGSTILMMAFGIGTTKGGLCVADVGCDCGNVVRACGAVRMQIMRIFCTVDDER